MREFIAALFDALNDVRRRTSSPMASLERSIAAAHNAHMAARRALAVAMAEETRETERRLTLVAKSQDLEQRAVSALRAGHENLAAQAAEAIAAMAFDINASEQASMRFAAEVTLARREVDAQRRRLSELDRGRRLAHIGCALAGANATIGIRSRPLQRGGGGLGKGRFRQSRCPLRPPGIGASGGTPDRAHGGCRVRRSDTCPRVRRSGAAPRRRRDRGCTSDRIQPQPLTKELPCRSISPISIAPRALGSTFRTYPLRHLS